MLCILGIRECRHGDYYSASTLSECIEWNVHNSPIVSTAKRKINVSTAKRQLFLLQLYVGLTVYCGALNGGPQCRMSNLRNGYVNFHYLCKFHVDF